MELKENMEAIFAHLEKLFTTKTVIGEPMVIGEVTLVPVVNVTFGLGTGGAEGKDQKDQGGGGLGAGTGARLIPAAVIVIRGSEVNMLPIAGRSTIENIVERAPEVLGKLKNLAKKDGDA